METFHFRVACHHIPWVFEAVDRRIDIRSRKCLSISLQIKKLTKNGFVFPKTHLVQSIAAPQRPYPSMTSDTTGGRSMIGQAASHGVQEEDDMNLSVLINVWNLYTADTQVHLHLSCKSRLCSWRCVFPFLCQFALGLDAAVSATRSRGLLYRP